MEFRIFIKDINKLGVIDVSAIYTRLSWPDSKSDSSMQRELDLRYMSHAPGPHPEMAIALVWFKGTLAGWVGTRLWPEKFKGETVEAQTIECFVDPEYRRRGFASLGLQALITAGVINRDNPVSVYAPAAVNVAKQCGCKTVLLCEPT
jgi:GNAT superfamily N-acetyltransferase